MTDKRYKITHGGRPEWSRMANTLMEAHDIIRRECGGYMDDGPHYNESSAIELWNESDRDGCNTYAIEEEW